MAACRRCGGWGVIPAYTHVESGVCRACHGSGKSGQQLPAERRKWIARAQERKRIREALAAYNALP